MTCIDVCSQFDFLLIPRCGAIRTGASRLRPRRNARRRRPTRLYWARTHAAITRRRRESLPSMTSTPGDITMLLHSVADGDRTDLDRLMAAIYEDLRRIASAHLREERADHTLQPTALVHEAYLKLVDQRSTCWKDRLHFFAIASQIIRRILIDHARERRALKRGGSAAQLPIDEVDPASPDPNIDLVALDEALSDLAEVDERQARIVELRFFGGCTIDEIAELLSVGRRTVDRDWMAAKAWLYCRLAEGGEEIGDDQ